MYHQGGVVFEHGAQISNTFHLQKTQLLISIETICLYFLSLEDLLIDTGSSFTVI